MFMPKETRTLEERVADLEKKVEELEKELNRKASIEALNKLNEKVQDVLSKLAHLPRRIS